MKAHLVSFLSIGLAALAPLGATAAPASLPLPRAAPEEVGMSSERLSRIASVLQSDVEHGRLPGAVVVVARKGKIVYFEAVGFPGKKAGAEMKTGALFKNPSMTKPLGAAATPLLVE